MCLYFKTISFQIRPNQWVDPTDQDCFAKNANHAIDGNLVKKMTMGAPTLVAVKPINPGDHLFWDYGIHGVTIPWTVHTMVHTINQLLLIKYIFINKRAKLSVLNTGSGLSMNPNCIAMFVCERNASNTIKDYSQKKSIFHLSRWELNDYDFYFQ